MRSAREAWLVAIREMRERSRSGTFRFSLVVMVLVVVGAVVLPALIDIGGGPRDVGLVGSVAADLPATIRSQGDAVSVTVRTQSYDTLAAGETAVRDGKVDVLVVDSQRLEWQRSIDSQLQAIVTGAIQLVAVRERATEAGISPEALFALVEPVPVENVELGAVAGRSADDETAAMIMTVLLFIAITTYGNLVLTGVVEEKSSRVVEVLLARIPARNLLAGKVAGIGLLGLVQFAITAVAALVAVRLVDSVDIPAVRPGALAWVVTWFVLGYALYAVMFGAFGAMATRAEDSSGLAGPLSTVLIVGYFASLLAVNTPDGLPARLVSLFPATAPLAMPSRIAMGATDWWEPWLAVLLALATTAGIIVIGGRMYAAAILDNGPAPGLRARWQRLTRRSRGGPLAR